MAEQSTQPELKMPARETLVAEAIGRLATAGLRSQIVGIDDTTLHHLCYRLTDRTVTVADAHRWLNTELGGTEEDQVVDDNAVYRFADHYRRIYGQVRAEYAKRIARLSVNEATDDNIRDMTRVAQHRLVELTAEKLVEADNFEDVGKAVDAAMFAIKFSQDAERGAAELELKREQAESRAAKLEQEVRKLELANDQAEAELKRIREAASKAKQSVDKAASKGDRFTREDVLAMVDKVIKGEVD